jgi:hypothetical protein
MHESLKPIERVPVAIHSRVQAAWETTARGAARVERRGGYREGEFSEGQKAQGRYRHETRPEGWRVE